MLTLLKAFHIVWDAIGIVSFGFVGLFFILFLDEYFSTLLKKKLKKRREMEEKNEREYYKKSNGRDMED